MKIIPFEMSHVNEMRFRNFDYDDFEQLMKIFSFQVAISETWTFVMDNIKCCVVGLIANKSNDTVTLWSFVDDIITADMESKEKFISLCAGMEKYISSKYKGKTIVATLIDNGIADYHNFPLHFGFKATSDLGKFGTLYERDF